MWPCTAKIQWTKDWIKIKFSAEAFALQGSNVKKCTVCIKITQPWHDSQDLSSKQDSWAKIDFSSTNGPACPPHLWTPLGVASHLAHLYQAAVQAGHVLQTQAPDKQLLLETMLGANYEYFKESHRLKREQITKLWSPIPVPLLWSSYFVEYIATKIVFFGLLIQTSVFPKMLKYSGFL